LIVGTSSIHPSQVQNVIDDGDEVQENNDDDESEETDDVLQEDSTQVGG